MLLLLLSVLLLLRLAAGLFEPVLLKLPPLLAHGLLVLEVFDLSQYNIIFYNFSPVIIISLAKHSCFNLYFHYKTVFFLNFWYLQFLYNLNDRLSICMLLYLSLFLLLLVLLIVLLCS